MNENKYMSKEYTNCMRGILAILVVVHHLYQYTGLLSGTYIGVILQIMGFLCVAMFFFYSGYGLMLSSRKKNYINTFFEKRFLPLYSFYVVLVILYSLWTLFLEKQISFPKVLQSFFFGGTVVTNGWYFQTTFFAYLLYYFCFKFFKTPTTQIISFTIAIIIYIVICIFIGLGISWYQTILCMAFGMIYCLRNNDRAVLHKKNQWFILGLSFVLFGICLLLSVYSGGNVIFDILYSVFFVYFAITLSYILCDTKLIQNKLFDWCGKYSLEIYVSHGFFLRLIKLKYIENTFLFIIIVVLGTFLTSVIMKKIHTRIILCWKKIHYAN